MTSLYQVSQKVMTHAQQFSRETLKFSDRMLNPLGCTTHRLLNAGLSKFGYSKVVVSKGIGLPLSPMALIGYTTLVLSLTTVIGLYKATQALYFSAKDDYVQGRAVKASLKLVGAAAATSVAIAIIYFNYSGMNSPLNCPRAFLKGPSICEHRV